MGLRFIPVKNFPAEVNGLENHYLRGATYTVHDTPSHKDLASKVPGWEREGLVIIIGRTSRPSRPHTIIMR